MPITRLMTKRATLEAANRGGKYDLGYDEDGVDNAPIQFGSQSLLLRTIRSMIEKLHDDRFKVMKKTPTYQNPYLCFDGCCYHPLSTKEEALRYWNGQLQFRLEEVERAKASKMARNENGER